jgi:hypothetical protein
MDERKHPIPPGEFRLRSASGRNLADIDPPPAGLAKSDDLVAIDGSSVAVYCGSEEEVCEGFLLALTVMGVARVEQLSEPAKPSVTEEKP